MLGHGRKRTLRTLREHYRDFGNAAQSVICGVGNREAEAQG